ncbi:hypothetical protein LQ567_16730 [Niabella pedocola]|uniref:Lanthionine synthetase C family protein n=1 Tax=Niabella pedocola TaxID=1752077 RepID=A0ABS8PVY2_9BACT|nr:lanthionine synthetase LanC family protein [Niabella pedocola]MCD2424427.1 hypothetical protein [Niabella pedocola]
MNNNLKDLVFEKTRILNQYYNNSVEHLLKRFSSMHTGSPYSVMVGVAGAILVKSAIYQIEPNETVKDAINNDVDYLLQKISESNSLIPHHCGGMSGFATLLLYLKKIKLIGLNRDFFYELDIFLEDELDKCIRGNNIDILHGGMGIGLYFIHRRKKQPIKKLLDYLDDHKDNYNGAYIWHRYDEYRAKDYIYDLGLAHGNASVMYFLTQCIKSGLFKKKSTNLLKGLMTFYLQIAEPESMSSFPSFILKQSFIKKVKDYSSSRIAWCYGDLGILYSMYFASDILQDNDTKNKSIEMLIKCSKRMGKDSGVIDAGFCHGSIGPAYMFKKLYNACNVNEFKIAEDFWISKTLEFGTEPGVFGNYLFLTDKGGAEQHDFLQGVHGISMVLNSYVCDIDSHWDSMLFLS